MQKRPHCPKCTSAEVSKNGKIKGVQRYKCKQCQYQFTRTTPRGRFATEKALAVTLYLMERHWPPVEDFSSRCFKLDQEIRPGHL